MGTLNFHATTSFNVKPGEGFSDAAAFWAHMIKVQSSSEPVDLYDVPNDDAQLIVTGALTSCAFVVQENPNGTISCAHVRPSAGDGTGTETGEALHDRLTGVGYTAVYGKRRYDHRDGRGHLDREVSIVGVRTGTGWVIYAQKMEPTAQYRIRSVHRVYPPE